MKSPFIIFLILLLDLIAFTIILPLFPLIIDYYDKKNENVSEGDIFLQQIHNFMDWVRDVLHMPDRRRYNNVLVGGILGSLFSFLQFLSSPLIGAFSDVFGRKKMLLLTMLGTLSSYAVWLKADTFSIFLLSRIIGGLCKGSVTLSTAMISDITTKENRGKGMAFIGLSFSFGFITGPLIGAYFASQAKYTATNSFAAPAQLAILFQILSLFMTLLVLDETCTKKQSLSGCLPNTLKLINPLNLFVQQQNDNAVLKRLTITNFFYLLFFSGLEFTLTFLTHERFNFTSMQQGKLFFFAGVVMMIVQGGYVRRVKQNKEKKIAMQGIIIIIPAMVLLSITTTVPLTYLALMLYSFGAGTVVPCLTSLFTQHSDESETGENVGVLRSAGALARAIAPALTCSVYWSFGSNICYMVGAGLFILPLLILIKTETVDHLQKNK